MKSNNTTEQVDTNYWNWKLKKYLQKSNQAKFIELHINDQLEDFLNLRSTNAAEEYNLAIKNGATQSVAVELANAQLFHGIEFSRNEHIESILFNHFPNDYSNLDENIAPEVINDIALRISAVYDKYLDQRPETMDVIEVEILPHIAQYIMQHRSTHFSV